MPLNVKTPMSTFTTAPFRPLAIMIPVVQRYEIRETELVLYDMKFNGLFWAVRHIPCSFASDMDYLWCHRRNCGARGAYAPEIFSA